MSKPATTTSLTKANARFAALRSTATNLRENAKHTTDSIVDAGEVQVGAFAAGYVEGAWGEKATVGGQRVTSLGGALAILAGAFMPRSKLAQHAAAFGKGTLAADLARRGEAMGREYAKGSADATTAPDLKGQNVAPGSTPGLREIPADNAFGSDVISFSDAARARRDTRDSDLVRVANLS